MIKPVLVPVMLCCNDHRNGLFTGEADGIQIEDGDGDILLAFDGYARLTHGAGFIRLGRCKYPIRRYCVWVGNWCCDCAYLETKWSAKLLNDLRRSGQWSPHMGHCWAWDRWKSTEPFVADDFGPDAHLAD